MTRDSFFRTAERLMEQIAILLEHENRRASAQSDDKTVRRELLENLEECQYTHGTGQVVKALEILLNYTCLIPTVTVVTDLSKSRLLVETDRGGKYQITVTETDEDF